MNPNPRLPLKSPLTKKHHRQGCLNRLVHAQPRILQFPLCGIFVCVGESEAGVPEVGAFNSLCVGFLFASSKTPCDASLKPKEKAFQFPLCGIFVCVFKFVWDSLTEVASTFNSLCVGFLFASPHTRLSYTLVDGLSIPSVWDFCLRPTDSSTRERGIRNFQFPLCGIFVCVEK